MAAVVVTYSRSRRIIHRLVVTVQGSQAVRPEVTPRIPDLEVHANVIAGAKIQNLTWRFTGAIEFKRNNPDLGWSVVDLQYNFTIVGVNAQI